MAVSDALDANILISLYAAYVVVILRGETTHEPQLGGPGVFTGVVAVTSQWCGARNVRVLGVHNLDRREAVCEGAGDPPRSAKPDE